VLMEAGRYTMRTNWKSVAIGDGYLAAAVIEFEEDGTVFVHLDGEPLLAFPDHASFFAAHSVAPSDLEAARRPSVSGILVRERVPQKRSA
jgi:hypothetical protein